MNDKIELTKKQLMDLILRNIPDIINKEIINIKYLLPLKLEPDIYKTIDFNEPNIFYEEIFWRDISSYLFFFLIITHEIDFINPTIDDVEIYNFIKEYANILEIVSNKFTVKLNWSDIKLKNG